MSGGLRRSASVVEFDGSRRSRAAQAAELKGKAIILCFGRLAPPRFCYYDRPVRFCCYDGPVCFCTVKTRFVVENQLQLNRIIHIAYTGIVPNFPCKRKIFIDNPVVMTAT